MMFDVEFINPCGNPGTLYAFIADSPEEACRAAPFALAISSQWRPEQFEVVSVKISTTHVHQELKK